MILLKDLLLEMRSLNLLIPRRVEDRMEKYIQTKAKEYIKNKNVGDFDISGLGLTTLPALLKNLKIGGSFDCGYNRLDSLVGAPTSVGRDFLCNDNKLTSLVGAPTSVKNFYCNNNLLKSLDGLIRLDGVRTSVGGDFHCYDNAVKFTEEQVRAVCDVKGVVYTY